MGFYGNGETSDGIHRATYSLRHANRTVAGVQDRVSGCMDGGGGLFLLLHPCVCMCVRVRRGRVRAPSVPWLIASSNLEQVWDTAAALNRTAEPSLQSLERQLAARPEPLRAVQRLQGLLQTLLGYTAAIPFWRNPAVSLEALAEQVDLYDWYRCGPLSCLPPLAPAPLSGSVRFQLPVPEVLLGEGLGSLVVTGRSPPWGRLLKVRGQSLYPECLWTLLWAPGCLPSSAQHPLLLPWDWRCAQPRRAVSLQVAGLPGPAAARRGHLPPGAGRPHPQLQGDPGRVSLRALGVGEG